jgi:hypothetical protein
MSTYKALLNEQSVDADSINAHDITTDTLAVADSVSLPSLAPESLLMTDPSSTVTTLTLTNGQIPIGATGAVPQASNLTGTTNQVNVSNGAGSITLSTPQDIATTSTPQFVSLKLTDPVPYSVLRLDASNVVQGNYLTDGQLLIGASNHAPYSQTLTAGANVTITNGAGTITIATSPATTFSSITDTGLTANTLVGADGTKTLQSMTLASNNGVAQSVATGTLTTDTPQDIRTSASPTFANLTDSGLTATQLVASDASKKLQSVTISNANGCNSSFSGSTQTNTMTQDLTTSGAPTFANLTDSGLTATSLVGANGSKQLQSMTFSSSNGVTQSVATNVLTTNTPQDLRTSASPSFSTVTLSGLSASLPLKLNGSKAATAAAINLASSEVTGVLPIGNLQVSAGSGIAISGGGVISASGSASLTDIALSNNTNQIALGTTHKSTINAPVASQAGDIVVTLPIVTSTLATLAGTETLTNKTLTAPIISTISNTGTLTLPTDTSTLLSDVSVQTIYNKQFDCNQYGSWDSGILNAVGDFTMFRSGTTITGGLTSFVSGMNPGWMIYPGADIGALKVTGFTNGTTLTSLLSGTIASTTFTLYYGASTTYSTGTIGCSTYYVTGAGTTWTAAMQGGFITVGTSNVLYITKFISATKLMVNSSQTIAAATAYTLDYAFPSCYSNRKASRSSATITGSNTNFVPAMVGGTLTFDDGTLATITAYNSATSLTTVSTGTVTSQGFHMQYGVPRVKNTALNTMGATGAFWPLQEVMRFEGNYKGRGDRAFMNFFHQTYNEDG